jgi:hypothetical protein
MVGKEREGTMFAIVNTMTGGPDLWGHIISKHIKLECAVKEDGNLQLSWQELTGQDNCVPTIIVEGTQARSGWAHKDRWVPVDPDKVALCL